MLIVKLNQVPYQIKSNWQDVSLADYIRFAEATTWSKRFIALNPEAALVWVSDPDLAMESMSFMGEDPLDNYLSVEGLGLPTIGPSTIAKYWETMKDIKDNDGINELALGAKIYATYMEKPEADVLEMRIVEVYGAICFFFKTLRPLMKDLKPSRTHRRTRTIIS